MNHYPSLSSDRASQPVFGRHVVITGVGRAGTTFLIQLLTRLGLETGLDALRDPRASYIVKCPMLCNFADESLPRGKLVIDHAIIPIRSFEAAAASRAYVQTETTGSPDGSDVVAGGLWDTQQSGEQATILRFKFTRLMEALVRHDVR